MLNRRESENADIEAELEKADRQIVEPGILWNSIL